MSEQPIPGPPPVYAPPPARKSRTGLVIALVAVGVLVVVGLAILGLVVAGGDDEASDPTPAASGEATASGSDVEMSGDLLEGDGYTYALPDEWQDITESVLADNPGTTIDSASAWGETIAAGKANLIVEHPSAEGVTDLEDARDQLRSNLEASFDAEIEDIDSREIDGVEMAGLHVLRTNEGGVEVDQTAYITLIDDSAYIITTSRRADEDESVAAFDAIYDSWSWD